MTKKIFFYFFVSILSTILLYSTWARSREIVEKGSFELYLDGVKKGQENYKIAVDKKKDTFEFIPITMRFFQRVNFYDMSIGQRLKTLVKQTSLRQNNPQQN